MPEPVHPDDAGRGLGGRASRSWTGAHPFPTCVVCGPEREPGDGYRIFPGPAAGHATASSPRRGPPTSRWRTSDGHVRPECLWGALDCPTSAPVANFGEGPPMVLARLTARIGCAVRVGEPHTLVSWPLEVDGRKRHGGCALFDESGRLLCASQALWIELRRPRQSLLALTYSCMYDRAS